MKLWLPCLAVVSIALYACAEQSQHPSANAGGSVSTGKSASSVCVDRDKDGYGENCPAGNDCDDHDPSVHAGCQRCAQPNDGCACDRGARPVQCFLDKTKQSDGGVMCNEGTRYCRNGRWSGCESILSYPLPEQASPTALIANDGGPVRCNDCNVDCFRITDNLDPVDGGLTNTDSTNVSWVGGGGLTLAQVPDAGSSSQDAGGPTSYVNNNNMCVLGTAPDVDCDGIPDQYDPYPNTPPFATANPAIFLQIPPGETGTGQIDLTFFLNSADVYFLVDQTGSMAEERDQIKASLTTGDFINDASYKCADYDFDHQPNNELKSQGIVGAIKCKIRDAQFGAGFFREIPFTGYANDDQTAFANYQDITGDVNAVLAAINRFTTIGNNDWPEASMVGLHNLLTGNGMYFGTTKRSIPPRTDCPASTWGYPCFRQKAVPIVVLFTDAEFHNGPDTNTYAYNPLSFSITSNSDSQSHPIANTNEGFNSAYNIGDVTSVYKTFAGDTTNMSADLSASLVGSTCLSDDAGHDAVFRFDLTQQKAVTIETTGSQFDTVLGLFTGIPGSPTSLPASTNNNEVGTSALDMGDVHGAYVGVTGNTSAMAADYQYSSFGTCGAGTSSPDAVFKFNVSAATQVAVDTSGSSFDTVIGLYSAAPALPPTYTAITPSPNTNDAYTSAYAAGELYNHVLAFSGDTTPLVSDYSNAQIGCNADGNGKDAVYSFTLANPTRVRLSTEGSSFDTVLGLYNNGATTVGSVSVSNSNELQASAYNVGTVDGKIFNLSGSTAGMAADYSSAEVGCSSNSSSPDAVFKFHLDNPHDVQIDTIGTSWDTAIALFNNSNIDPATYFTATNTNELYSSAYDLGTINGTDDHFNGGTTSNMAGDYTTSDVSCTSSNLAPDAVYKFNLSSPTTVLIDLNGSSYDTVLSLHQGGAPPPDTSNTSGNANDKLASAQNVGTINNSTIVWNGNDSSLANDYPVGCGSDGLARDAVYQFTLSSATQVQIDTIGTSWDTTIGLFPSTITQPPTPTSVGNSNKTFASAKSIGALDGNYFYYTGSTSGANDDSDDTNCSANKNSEDSFFTFTLSGTKNVTIKSSGTGFTPVIQLYKSVSGSWVYQSCNNSSLSQSLTAGTYAIMLKGTSGNGAGTYKLQVQDDANPMPTSNEVTCDDDSGGGVTSKIVQNLSAGTYTVVVSGYASTNSGSYKVRFRDLTWYNAQSSEVSCNDDISGTNISSRIQTSLAAGNYWFVVKGYASTSKGAYALRVADVTNPPSGPGSLACDDNSGGGTQSKLTESALAAGDYWVVLKGHTSSAAGTYKLNIKDLSATASGAIIACDDNGGDSPQSALEQNLNAGTYQVVVKGKTATDQGAYKLQLRDVTNQPYSILACDNDGGPAATSYLEQNLAAGTYYVALKGHTATAKGAYSLSLRDVTNRPLQSTSCNDNGSTYSTSKISTTLNAGTYYVTVKGKTSTQSGPYLLSLGGGATSSGTYTPPTWATTLTAIQNTQAHVIPILSCHDDPSHGDLGGTGDCVYTRQQATSLANDSNALGPNLAPLVFDIDSNGTGLSTAVVNAVSQLAAYLEMDISVRVVFDPDMNPGFIVNVKAVDQAGDGCQGVIGITHQRCAPGSTPRFQITFQNPLAPNSIPLNPNDPNGGYNFRAELIGDNQFIVDKVPIYIIPEAANTMMGPPPAPTYYPSGTYWQDTSSPGCTNNQAPDWHDLSWNASVYPNTSVTFSTCAATTAAGLSTCTPHQVVTVNGAGMCASSADCALGYCDTGIGVCQVVTSGSCTSSSQCPSNAFCDMNSMKCTFTSQPVYIGGVLGSDNFKAFLRMKIDLAGTGSFTNPPVVHSWDLTYECNQVL